MTLFDYNSTELLVKNKSVHPPIIFKKTVMHSHNNLEIILLQLDRKFKNSFFSGLCCLFLFHFPFLVIFLSILAAITYFLYWYIIDWYTSCSCCVLRTLTGVSDSDATPNHSQSMNFTIFSVSCIIQSIPHLSENRLKAIMPKWQLRKSHNPLEATWQSMYLKNDETNHI